MQGHGPLNSQLLGTFLTQSTIAAKHKLAENKLKNNIANYSKWIPNEIKPCHHNSSQCRHMGN